LIASDVAPSTLLKAKLTALLATPKSSIKIDSFLIGLDSLTSSPNESASAKNPNSVASNANMLAVSFNLFSVPLPGMIVRRI